MPPSGTTPLQVLQVSITMTMAAAMVSKQKHNDCKQKAEQRTDKTTKTQTTNNENYGDDEPKGPPCGDCKRPRLTLNTIPVGRYKDEKYLPFVKENQAKCIPCKNYQVIAYLNCGNKPEELRAKIHESEASFAVYIKGLEKWESEFIAAHDSGLSRIRKGCIPELTFPTVVDVHKTSDFVCTRDTGVHWPVWMWERKFRKKANPAKIINLEEDDGTFTPGIVMGSEHGNPTGTTKMEKKWGQGMKKSTRTGDSMTELRKGQTEAAAEAGIIAINAITPSIVKPGDKEREDSPLTLRLERCAERSSKKRKAEAEAAEASSSDEGRLDWNPLPMLAKAKAKVKAAKTQKPSEVPETEQTGESSVPVPKMRGRKRRIISENGAEGDNPGSAASGDSAFTAKFFLAYKAAEGVLVSGRTTINQAGTPQIMHLTDALLKTRIDAFEKKLATRGTLLPDPCLVTEIVVTDNGTISGQELIDKSMVLLDNLEVVRSQLVTLRGLLTSLAPLNIKGDKERKAALAQRPGKQWASGLLLWEDVQLAKAANIGLDMSIFVTEVAQRVVESSLDLCDSCQAVDNLCMKTKEGSDGFSRGVRPQASVAVAWWVMT